MQSLWSRPRLTSFFSSIGFFRLAGQARPASAVRYMYETRKGMSPKTLFCYDLMVPDSFVPVNQDGEVSYRSYL